MKKDVDELPLSLLVHAHEGSNGEIDNENAKADGDKEKGFEFLLDGQIDKDEPEKPHDHVSPIEVDNSGLEDYSMEKRRFHYEGFTPRPSLSSLF